MDNTDRDPVDHARTTRQHAGETMKNTRSTPGLILGMLGVLAFVICLFLFSTGRQTGGVIAAVVAVLTGAAGVVWVLTEHRRVNRAEANWAAKHPGAYTEPPTA